LDKSRPQINETVSYRHLVPVRNFRGIHTQPNEKS
jgi:hypothetical protein